MLFVGILTPRDDTSEEDQKRALSLFASWTPPVEFKAMYTLASGCVVSVAEADSAEAMLEAAAPWLPYFDVDIQVALETTEAVPVLMKVNAWRDSVQ